MAIEFEHAGKKYRADTPAEAAALRFELERQDAVDGTYAKRNIWTADRTMDLLNGIGDLQKRFLTVLAQQPHSNINSEALTKAVGLDSEMALAGVVSGLSKQLQKMSI